MLRNRAGRLAFVPPRFGPEVIGGAEAVLREAAGGLADRGWEVEVLTTCAADHVTWENVYPPGTSSDGAVIVRRFPVTCDTAGTARVAVEAGLLAGQPVTLSQQERWMNDGPRAPDLFDHLLDGAERYRAIVFAPYPSWTTFACGQVAPERTLLMPCLHDEPMAWLELFSSLFSGARALWFLTEPEHDLAHRIHGDLPAHRVLGAGVDVPAGYDPDGFRRRHRMAGRFLLYAGRREGGKGWEALLAALGRSAARQALPLPLVTTGVGAVSPPAALADQVVDLGLLPAVERDSAFAAAAAYVQPSRLESFSRTTMEAWLAGTPVLADGGSEVSRWHVERSGGGLLYDDEHELAECIRFVAEAPDAAMAMAEAGRRYVLDSYRWPGVLDRLEAAIDEWFPCAS